MSRSQYRPTVHYLPHPEDKPNPNSASSSSTTEANGSSTPERREQSPALSDADKKNTNSSAVKIQIRLNGVNHAAMNGDAETKDDSKDDSNNLNPSFSLSKKKSIEDIIEENRTRHVFLSTTSALPTLIQTHGIPTPRKLTPQPPSSDLNPLNEINCCIASNGIHGMNGSHGNTNTSSSKHSSQCTNDPPAPIISLDKVKQEFKTVSKAAVRLQFICETYRRCKDGTVREKDFQRFENVLNHVYDQLIKRRLRKHPSLSNVDSLEPRTPGDQSPLPNHDSSHSDNGINHSLRPPLIRVADPMCKMCGTRFPKEHCYCTCDHPLCLKCLVNTFTFQPKNPRWYMCPVNGCRAMLPPEAHFVVLSFKPQMQTPTPSPADIKKYNASVKEYKSLRNKSYKNMLKIVGEYLSSKLKFYERWRKCENCDFGFLADPDVNWYQVFELKCVVCNVVQRVQLLGPSPCDKISLKKSYYPHDSLMKTLLFVRHGEAQNNVRHGNPNLMDPNLTERGQEQCRHLQHFVGRILNVDCILCSSMNRTIQTAAIGIYRKERSNMVPFVVLENLRERLSPSFNRRERITVKKERFNELGIDWSECKMDEDQYFDVERKNEKYDDMNKRAWQFYKYLLGRKEQTIAIVSHEGMLQCLTNIIESNDKCIRRSFKNAEARLCFLTHKK